MTDKSINKISYKDEVLDIINTLELESETDKSILKSRFLGEVLNYENRRNYTKKYYNAFRFIVTTGSILLPAVLSMGQMDPAKLPKNFDTISYWISWTISLMVTASNGFLQLFSLDKNYFEFALTTEQLKTEGWQFFQLSGKYEDCEDHKEAYKPFSKSIENIKRKQVEKEFSGKGDVNKNKGGKEKKKPEFDFQKELLKQLPDKYEGKQMQPLETKMDSKLNQLDSLMSMLNEKSVASMVGNVTEEIPPAKDVVKDVIDASVEKIVKSN